MIQYTDHSALRSAQRGLSDDEIEYVYQFGSRYHRSGALICYLRWKDLPQPDRRKDWAMHLVGTALVFARDGRTLLTAWRNRRKGLKIILKKEEFRRGISENYSSS